MGVVLEGIGGGNAEEDPGTPGVNGDVVADEIVEEDANSARPHTYLSALRSEVNRPDKFGFGRGPLIKRHKPYDTCIYIYIISLGSLFSSQDICLQ